jgi:hypothetical protein
VEHLSNGIWSVVPSPNPSEEHDILYGVAALSDSDGWAVGAYHLGAGRLFAFDEAHRSAADMVRNLLERIGRGDPLRHHESDRRSALLEREQHFRVGFFEYPCDAASAFPR